MGIFTSPLHFWQRESMISQPIGYSSGWGGGRFGNHCGLLKENYRKILRGKVGYIHSNRGNCGRIPEKGKEIKSQESSYKDSTMEMTTSRTIPGTS